MRGFTFALFLLAAGEPLSRAHLGEERFVFSELNALFDGLRPGVRFVSFVHVLLFGGSLLVLQDLRG